MNKELNTQYFNRTVKYEGSEGDLYDVSIYLNFQENEEINILFDNKVTLEKMYIVAKGVSITEPSINLPVSWATIYGYASFSGLSYS